MLVLNVVLQSAATDAHNITFPDRAVRSPNTKGTNLDTHENIAIETCLHRPGIE
jgi:hypothetical protein